MKKLILAGMLATAVIFSMDIAHGRQLETKFEAKTITKDVEKVPATGEIQFIPMEAQSLAMICKSCPNPDPACTPTCARQVVGMVLSITSKTDFGGGCTAKFQTNASKSVKLISHVTGNQSKDDLDGTFNALCTRLAFALMNRRFVRVEISPKQTGEAYLYSVTLFDASNDQVPAGMDALFEHLDKLTVDELYDSEG